MKRSIYLLSIGVLVVSLLGLAGCNLWTPQGNPAGAASPTVGPGQGAIKVKVQTVSPSLMALIQRVSQRHAPIGAKAAASKAYIGAQKIEFTVTSRPGGAQVDAWTDTPAQMNPGASFAIGTRVLNYGDYTLHASVYNNPADPTPTVGGSVDFTVVDGQSADDPGNTILVPCLPLGPVPVTEGASSTPFTLPVPWIVNFQGGGISQLGSETWFSTVPTTASTNFVLTPESGSMVMPAMLVFDEFGDPAGMAQMPTAPGLPVSIGNVGTNPGHTYYVAVVDFADITAPSRLMNLSYGPCIMTQDANVPTSAQQGALAAYMPETIAAFHFQTYSFGVTSGHMYNINWDDSGCGSGVYSGNIMVSAYEDAALTIPLFTPRDQGYKGSSYYAWGQYWTYSIDDTQTFTATPTQTTIYLKVEEYAVGMSAGTFALRIEDLGTNHPPNVYAWTNGNNIGVGSSTTLSANASDPDMDLLSYEWSIISGPSFNGLSNIHAQSPAFTPDTAGTYQIQVTVTDNGVPPHSATAMCYVTAIYNSPPVFDWAYPSTWDIVLGNTPVYLYASAHDPEDQSITYQWSISARPTGSYCSLMNPTQANSSLTADVAGTYQVDLVVTDSMGGVTSTSFTINVEPDPGVGGVGVGIN